MKDLVQKKGNKSLLLFSPAKLNLFFRVLRRREDGFHEIASRYQAISLGDLLHFERAEHDQLTCDDPTLSCGEDNLINKALKLFRKRVPHFFPVRIHLTKNIPMQSGLGGGSSNAATTLWALNELTGSPLSIQDLIELGAEFGSDISFFFSSGASQCRGRGEILEECSRYHPAPFWVAKPNYSLSTPEVYKNLDASSLPQRDAQEAFASFSSGNPQYYNDLEQSAFRLRPELNTFRKQLEDLGFTKVVMTGSGTAFFCFGQVERPVLEETSFFPVNFVFRKDGSWYDLPASKSNQVVYPWPQKQESTTTNSSSSPEPQGLSVPPSFATSTKKD